jgi:FlaA1/EpsC-like NDP-sugar epimerase
MVEYTGLRPGEKLYEELLSNKENTVPTEHSRIRIAKVREYDYSIAASVLSKLEHLANNVEITEMVRLMKQTIPEYISQNSRFEKLDPKA